MTVRTTISITEAQMAFIQEQIAAGRMVSVSEAVRAALNAWQQHVELINDSIEQAERDGFSERTPAQIRADVLRRHEEE